MTTIIYDYFSPAYKAGGPTQSLNNLVANLNTTPLKIVTTNLDLDGSVLAVKPDEWMNFKETASKVWYASTASRPLIKEMIDSEAVLFINSIYSHHFDYIALLRSKAKRKIISPRGMLDQGSLSQKSWKKKAYLTYWKLLGLHKTCEWHATTELEKENIQRTFGKNQTIWVVPNFPKIISYHKVPKQVDELKLITVALISPMKNHLLALEALQKCTGRITYDIYGPIKEQDYWYRCLEAIKNLPDNITVNYHGDLIPSDLDQALQAAHVFIQPSKSENFGHSLFEAMTAGKPIITSHNTPWNQLTENRAGINVSIDSTTDIEQAIQFFTRMDSDDWQLWNESCRNYALSKIDIPAIKNGYLQMFENRS